MNLAVFNRLRQSAACAPLVAGLALAWRRKEHADRAIQGPAAMNEVVERVAKAIHATARWDARCFGLRQRQTGHQRLPCMLMPIEPVAIWEAGHARRVLDTVEGAARCLTEGWPGDRKQPSYRAACIACLAALEGSGTAAKARAAIVRAAQDAGIEATTVPQRQCGAKGHLAG